MRIFKSNQFVGAESQSSEFSGCSGKSQRAETPPLPTQDSWTLLSSVIQSKWQINGLATINYPCGPYLKQTRGANQGNCQHHNEDLITLKCCKSLWLFFLPAEQRAGVSLRKGAATSAEVIIKLKRKKDARRAKSYPEASREIPQAVPKARPQFCCWNQLRGVLMGGSNQDMKFFSQSLSSVLSTPILLLFDWNSRKRGSILKMCDCPLCLRSEVDSQGSDHSSATQHCNFYLKAAMTLHKALKTTNKNCSVASSRGSSSSLTRKSPALPCSPQLFMHKQYNQHWTCSSLVWRNKHLKKSSTVNL